MTGKWCVYPAGIYIAILLLMSYFVDLVMVVNNLFMWGFPTDCLLCLWTYRNCITVFSLKLRHQLWPEIFDKMVEGDKCLDYLDLNN